MVESEVRIERERWRGLGGARKDSRERLEVDVLGRFGNLELLLVASVSHLLALECSAWRNAGHLPRVPVVVRETQQILERAEGRNVTDSVPRSAGIVNDFLPILYRGH